MTYEILNQSDLAGLDYSQLQEDSASSGRLSNDGLKGLVAYEGSRPSTLSAITALTVESRTTHTRTDLISILKDETSTGWAEEAA